MKWFQFAVIEASSGTHIGDLAASVDATDPRLATIGFTLASAAHGNGYATLDQEWALRSRAAKGRGNR